jgi:hypothetical protein
MGEKNDRTVRIRMGFPARIAWVIRKTDSQPSGKNVFFFLLTCAKRLPAVDVLATGSLCVRALASYALTLPSHSNKLTML